MPCPPLEPHIIVGEESSGDCLVNEKEVPSPSEYVESTEVLFQKRRRMNLIVSRICLSKVPSASIRKIRFGQVTPAIADALRATDDRPI